MAELEMGAFRPGASSLFFKDFVWSVFVLAAAFLWVQALVIWPMIDDGSAEMADATSILLIMAAADSVFAAVVVYWRYGRAKGLAERGVVTKARFTKVTEVGEPVGIEYEFLVEGKTHKGRMGWGMLATREELRALVGRDMMLLVDPQKPKVHLRLSKLG